MKTSPKLKAYFEQFESDIDLCYNLANKARAKGYDPDKKVDIPLAKGISERVEGLISAIAPQVLNSGIAERIKKLEREFGSLDWRVALKIAEEVAKQKFCKFDDKIKAMETGIRIGLAYITLGVISAPLEGFIELKLKNRADGGGQYFSLLYAGPIRAAGGTAAAVSTIIADYVRIKMGYAPFDPTEKEVKRFQAELRDYHERVTNLQYFPSAKEIEFLAKNLPIEINGDPTEEIEVSNYKDLPRIDTNRIRGGMCLVFAEGLCLKSPKLYKRIAKWGKSMELSWDFLGEFLDLQKKVKALGSKKKESDSKLKPNFTFIKDLVAGRPVLTHPMARGGLRLRYGRTRLTGLAASAMHPATLLILNKYIATGTQLKMERPGKATAISPCSSIEGPIVKLKDQSVMQLHNQQQADENQKNIQEILFLGDILFNYGDFSENGHKLVPVGYCEEWWMKEFEKACVNLFGCFDLDRVSVLLDIKKEHLEKLVNEPIKTKITFRLAINISKKLNIPLHPMFTFYWSGILTEELTYLRQKIKESAIKKENNVVIKIIAKKDNKLKEILEKIGIEHLFVNNDYIVLEKDWAFSLYILLNIESKENYEFSDDIFENLSKLSGLHIRDKSGTFIGARMGRPEKAKMRKLLGSPHILFPIGVEGGRLRSFQAAISAGKITADFPICYCQKCKTETIYGLCETCGSKTQKKYICKVCGIIDKPCQKHGSKDYSNYSIDIKKYMDSALEKLGTRIYPDLIKGVKGTSNKDHVPEHLIKGILRAKHSIFVNKDGTTRYDMIEMPVTHFTPKEIGTSIKRLKSLGYTTDIKGKTLETESQMIEIFPQDIIMPNCPESPDEWSEDVLFRVCNYIDELLVKLYGLEPFYNLNSSKDLIGQYIIGLAPHTSAGTVGRIIGFSKTQAMFTHPLFHAAMRRNCDGDEACAIMLMDALLNFSRSFLPDRRGSRTMDAPLVLTSLLDPAEVDDEVHGMDVVWDYPLELYEAAQKYKNPWKISIKQISNCLGTESQYEGMGYTHKVSNMNSGVVCSAYKTLPSMREKLAGQMDLAEKIRAVDTSDVARLVIEKHFIKDIKGNLKKYSTQQFRCVKCNEKYRRPPLRGKCRCGGKIIFTISEGSIVKYLEPSLSLARKYGVSSYLQQTLDLTERRVEDVLGKPKDRQEGLGKWFG